MQLIHHGAHQGVTGSCHQLLIDPQRSLLVDCGTFQGRDAEKHTNPEIEFPLQGILALLLTHVHIDHVGRLPYLLAAGFDRPIYCSRPTAELLPLVMEDSLKIGFSRSVRLTADFLRKIGRLLRPLSYGEWQEIVPGIRIRLRPAGHVLGSTIFEVELPGGRVVVFSGDLGPVGAGEVGAGVDAHRLGLVAGDGGGRKPPRPRHHHAVFPLLDHEVRTGVARVLLVETKPGLERGDGAAYYPGRWLSVGSGRKEDDCGVFYALGRF
jgi:hypothetical protein